MNPTRLIQHAVVGVLFSCGLLFTACLFGESVEPITQTQWITQRVIFAIAAAICFRLMIVAHNKYTKAK